MSSVMKQNKMNFMCRNSRTVPGDRRTVNEWVSNALFFSFFWGVAAGTCQHGVSPLARSYNGSILHSASYTGRCLTWIHAADWLIFEWLRPPSSTRHPSMCFFFQQITLLVQNNTFCHFSTENWNCSDVTLALSGWLYSIFSFWSVWLIRVCDEAGFPPPLQLFLFFISYSSRTQYSSGCISSSPAARVVRPWALLK